MVKRKITKLMAVNNKEWNTSTNSPESQILEFRNIEKVKGIPNKIFTLVIMVIRSNFDVSMILIEDKSSYNIMYSYLFEKMGLKKEKLWSYEGSDLQAFNSNETCLWG